MFQTILTADLPSVERPGAAPGDDDFAPSHDRLSYGSAHVLDLIRRAFAKVDVVDLAWIRIDDDLVYADHDASSSDELRDLLDRAADEGYLGRSFQELEMGLVHEEGNVLHVAEVLVQTAVPAGEPEMRVRLSSRPLDLSPQVGEAAEVFARRLEGMASDERPLMVQIARVQDLRDRIAKALRDVFHQSSVEAKDVHLVLVRPSRDELLSLNALPFGHSVIGVSYDLSPGGRWPWWDDPALKVYDDPYLVFRHLALLEAVMRRGKLRHAWVRVVDGQGKALFDGTGAKWFESWPWRSHFELAFADQGVQVTYLDA